MQSNAKHVVIIGTGGTIAGVGPNAADPLDYRAAQLSIETLVSAAPFSAAGSAVIEQLAQIDSKDMTFAIWHALAERLSHHLADPMVAGVVVTHGTDTLEETAYLLQRLLAPIKPVVLTAAMRPATDSNADGPRNLADAAMVAAWKGAQGVLVVLAGKVWSGLEVRKAHTQHADAFNAGDKRPLAIVERRSGEADNGAGADDADKVGRVDDGGRAAVSPACAEGGDGGVLRIERAWPAGAGLGIDWLPRDDDAWPWVEVLQSGAGASGAAVRALVRAGVRGVVAAGTGNGTLHLDLLAALTEAQANGVAVRLSTRCASGPVTTSDGAPFESAGDLTAAQARVELMLQLMARSGPSA